MARTVSCKTMAADAIADDDMEALADAALLASDLSQGNWSMVWGEVLDILRELPVPTRRRLADVCPARYEAADAGSPARYAILTLLAVISPGLPDDVLIEERQKALENLAHRSSSWFAIRSDVLAAAELAAGRALSPAVVAVFRRSAQDPYRPEVVAELAQRLTEPVLNVGEQWADRALAELPGLAEPWRRLLMHAITATAAKPSARWEKTGRALVAEIGPETVREIALPWLALVGRARTIPLERGEYEREDVNRSFDAYNANAVRGLAWLLSFLPPHPGTVRTLGTLAETSLRKVTGMGPRSPKIANACVIALGQIDGEASLAELARLTTRVTYKGTFKILDTALGARAQALGLSREEMEELAVPAYGLTEVGRSVARFGEATAELVVNAGGAKLSWRTAAGQAVKSVPADVRRDHAEELKELKAAIKDIDKMLTAQTERLDRQFLARRPWPYAAWRERYLDHPLVGTLARRLLWTVGGVACGFADGALRDLADAPVAEGGTVELWHPVGRETAEIVAWRDWLERHGITQPFKQAHREVYLLTDAERRTDRYSNRFAAHILRQHQFHALTAVRGWRNKLRLFVDDSVPPATRELPQWNLRAEFWVEGDGDQWGVDTTESGSYLRLRTDQVRFYPIDAPENVASSFGGPYTMLVSPDQGPVDPIPLADVPGLVLSEVLRDVDLFVGVASVGNDPTWQDGGPGGRFLDYWTSYSFGELNQSAQTRRDLLARLLPRLAIGGQCVIEGRFLHVRGSRHTYKIHLGSGNILMTPDDRYLCIVPGAEPVADGASRGRTAGDAVGPYLPFDGDRTLSIILSKAMMLARDTEITDPAILGQL